MDASITNFYTPGNFRTLLLISGMYKTLHFPFEAFRAVKLVQQIAAKLELRPRLRVYTFYIPCRLIEVENKSVYMRLTGVVNKTDLYHELFSSLTRDYFKYPKVN